MGCLFLCFFWEGGIEKLLISGIQDFLKQLQLHPPPEIYIVLSFYDLLFFFYYASCGVVDSFSF